MGQSQFLPDDDARHKLNGLPKILQFLLRATRKAVLNFMAIHLIMWRHFTQNLKCEPHGGATGKVRRSPKSLRSTVLTPIKSTPNVKVIYPAVIEIFQSGPKCQALPSMIKTGRLSNPASNE